MTNEERRGIVNRYLFVSTDRTFGRATDGNEKTIRLQLFASRLNTSYSNLEASLFAETLRKDHLRTARHSRICARNPT